MISRSQVGLLVLTLSFTVACSKNPATDERTSQGPAREPATVKESVIYGADDRRELFEEQDPAIKAVAHSTVALIKNGDLSPNGDGTSTIRGSNFGTSYHLCADEPYRDQDTAAFCSGFLVGPNTIVTAGHCISSARDCSEVSFVFGYAYHAAGVAPRTALAEDIYRCSSIIHTQAPSNGADFAVIKLDRSVVHRAPLKLRSQGSVAVGDELVVIGYPTGLPMKIAGGAKVRDNKAAGFFVANLDTYGGNSGSAVFNRSTLDVEGILVRGEADFASKPEGCMVSNVCSNEGCRGEDVTRIEETLKYLPAKKPRRSPRPSSTRVR